MIAGGGLVIGLISGQQAEIERLCDAFGVVRLEVFGSAKRRNDFEFGRSDLDFLVTFSPNYRNDVEQFLAFEEALSALLGQPIDLVEREAVEQSRNPLRKSAILGSAALVYG